jgi:hypothetical protein
MKLYTLALCVFILTTAIVFAADRSAASEAAVKLHKDLWPRCALCGTTNNLTAHHIMPVHIKPALDANQTNLITLCEYHHLRDGHKGSFATRWNSGLKSEVGRILPVALVKRSRESSERTFWRTNIPPETAQAPGKPRRLPRG